MDGASARPNAGEDLYGGAFEERFASFIPRYSEHAAVYDHIDKVVDQTVLARS